MKITALVISAELRKGGKNEPFWEMGVRDAEGVSYKAIIWEAVNPPPETYPNKGDYVLIDLEHPGVKDKRDTKFNNISLVVDAITKIDKEKIEKSIKDKIDNVNKASPEQLEKSYKIITDKSLYKDLDTYVFVMNVFGSLPKDKLFTCPGGKGVHHAFQGGLICHIAEVIQVCKGIVATFPNKNLINPDVVFAGASLHDIGKIYIYDIDEFGTTYTTTNSLLVGHMCQGISIVEKIGLEKNFDKDLLLQIMHIIASHHDRIEYNAIMEPHSLEASIVAKADYISFASNCLESELIKRRKNNTKLESQINAAGKTFLITQKTKEWFSNQPKG